MPKATPTQQAVILLSLAASSLITIRDQALLPELKDVLDKGIESMLRIIEDYPTDGNEQASETEEIFRRVTSIINNSAELFSIEAAIFLGHKVCTDLLGELCHPVKRALVEEARQINKVIDDYLDPDGENVEVYIEIEEILNEVYKEVGFVEDLRFFKHREKLQRRLKNHGRTSC